MTSLATWFRSSVVRLASAAALAIAVQLLVLAAPAVPVSAAGGSSASCIAVLPDIAGWFWVSSPQPEVVVYPVETGALTYAIDGFPNQSYPSSWSGLDNPAPLIWLVRHYPTYAAAFANLFSSCEVYSPSLVQRMNADHFAPSMVGGVNPPGVTATTAPSPEQQQPTPTPQPSPSPQPTPAPQPSPSPSPQSPTASPTPPEPPSLTPPPYVSVQRIQEIWHQDEQLVAQGGEQHGGQGNGAGSGSGVGRGHHRHPLPIREYAAAAAVILIAVSVVWWRRRATRRHRW